MNQEPKELSRTASVREVPNASEAADREILKPSDKREICRRRQLKGGQISYQDGHMTLDCMVRDLSDSGARIKVLGSVSPPDYFNLKVELDGICVDCEVVWRAGPLLGVHFVQPVRKMKITRLQVINAQSQRSKLRKD
ncbi:MAG: PilZ domain-containing protein [Methyloligellaceae bacterium]